ncbi:MAG: sulfatase [Colwellia sp.]|nr:sulfatase [Colwellia sp.]MCW9082273.1 sulfatase [Colwellia sp.]
MKKNILKTLVALCVLSATNQVVAADNTGSSETEQRPNILFIMSDDHAFQALSAYGHPVSKLAPTPNLDRIAKNGMRFNKGFVTNSLCGPSRAAMLTGKFGHKNGYSYNGQTFDGSQQTWPKMLKEAGYTTAVIGKWHIGKKPTGLNFDFWKILNDQGEYYNPDFITKEGVEKKVPGYATDLVTDYSLQWLDKQRDKSKPFALLMHHKAPHRNWMPALRHLTQYENIEFPVPANYFDDYKGRVAAAEQKLNIYRDMYEGHDLKMTKSTESNELRYDRWPDHFARLTKEQRATWDAAYKKRNDDMNNANFDEKEMALWKYQRYMQDYLATISAVDESIGEVLNYLEATGLSDNTLVVYTSDQGFYLGEHGWFDKRFMYEESMRAPLLMQFPGKIPAGSVSEELVQNIDFAPTFLEYAGVDVPEDIQGESLTPITSGEPVENWRQSLYYHYYEFPGFHSVKRHFGVRDQRFKLIHFYNDVDEWEFYDLEKDPSEMNNAINDPEYKSDIARMKAELTRLMTHYDEPDYAEWKDAVLKRGNRWKKGGKKRKKTKNVSKS